MSGELICAKCLGRREKPRKREGTYPQKWWGLITEPIDNIGPQVNKMVYSPWFLEKAKKYSLSQESMVRAKKMYEAAVAGIEAVPPVPDLAAVEATIPVSQEAPKKAGRKKKEVVAAAAAAAETPAPAKEKKKPGPKPKASGDAKPKAAEAKPKASTEAKPKAAEAKPKTAESLPPITAIVETSEPVPSEDTVFIKVRHFEHADRSYFVRLGET